MTKTLVLLIAASVGYGQTLVDLQNQAKNIDFSGAIATRPMKVGATFPATCSNGDMFFLAGAPAGANVYGCGASNVWSLEASVGVSSQLEDFALTETGPAGLTIGANCQVNAPCNVRFGSMTYSFTAPATATLASGTGLLYIYIASTGALTLGSNLGVTCVSACAAVSGITAFPISSIPLFTWAVTSGTLNTGGLTDFRGFLSTFSLITGTGMVSSTSVGTTTVSVDDTLVSLRVAVPASSSSGCNTGVWAADTTYYYLCMASNTWQRVALLTW
jgi:hypothetical protein